MKLNDIIKSKFFPPIFNVGFLSNCWWMIDIAFNGKTHVPIIKQLDDNMSYKAHFYIPKHGGIETFRPTDEGCSSGDEARNICWKYFSKFKDMQFIKYKKD